MSQNFSNGAATMSTAHRNHHRKARELEELYRLPYNPPPSCRPVPRAPRSLLPTVLVSLCCTLLGAVCYGVNLGERPSEFTSLSVPFVPDVPVTADAFALSDVHTDRGAAAIHQAMQAGHVNAQRSTITGVVDNNSMTAALYWTIALKNDNNTDKEASILVDLPKNAAVSRATLWINGVPQEAAFASDQQVKAAYDWIVVRHRDPLLVTQVAPNRIKILAAPVLANGGTMQIRLGLTVPFENELDGRKSLSLPHIVESNLKFDCLQDVHLTSAMPMISSSLLREGTHWLGGERSLLGNIPAEALAQAKIFVGDPEFSVVATRLTHTSPSQYVVASNNGTSLILNRVSDRPNCPVIARQDAAARLSSLWAHQEIERLAERGDLTSACELANRYRIVSSVSGAVVLETDADYQNVALNRDMYRSQSRSSVAQAPMLQGATNGTIGPQGSDATVIAGVNTAGAVRVNNVANLEILLVGWAKLASFLLFAIAVNLAAGAVLKQGLKPTRWSKRKTLLIAGSLAVTAVVVPRMMQALLSAAMGCDLFSFAPAAVADSLSQ